MRSIYDETITSSRDDLLFMSETIMYEGRGGGGVQDNLRKLTYELINQLITMSTNNFFGPSKIWKIAFPLSTRGGGHLQKKRSNYLF